MTVKKPSILLRKKITNSEIHFEDDDTDEAEDNFEESDLNNDSGIFENNDSEQNTALAQLGSIICRWVNNDGTVCGKAFSELDSLRDHIIELHKGLRPLDSNNDSGIFENNDSEQNSAKENDDNIQFVSVSNSSGGPHHHSNQPSIPFLSLTNPLPQAHKPLG